MTAIDTTLQKDIVIKFPDILHYPKYTFEKDVLDFLFNFAQSDGHVGVLFGLPGTGKKNIFATNCNRNTKFRNNSYSKR